MARQPLHGKYSEYKNHACRCEPCTEANREYNARARLRRVECGPPDDIHGRESTYGNWSCRCDACKAAHAAHAVEWRRRKRRGEVA